MGRRLRNPWFRFMGQCERSCCIVDFITVIPKSDATLTQCPNMKMIKTIWSHFICAYAAFTTTRIQMTTSLQTGCRWKFIKSKLKDTTEVHDISMLLPAYSHSGWYWNWCKLYAMYLMPSSMLLIVLVSPPRNLPQLRDSRTVLDWLILQTQSLRRAWKWIRSSTLIIFP